MMTMFVRTRENEILKQLDNNLLNGLKIFTFIVLYCPVVPFTILVMIELSNVCYARRIQANYRNFKASDDYQDFILSNEQKSTKPHKTSNLMTKRIVSVPEKPDKSSIENESVTVVNPNILPDLGCAEHIFFDKTGTLVVPDYEIMTVATQSKLYKSEENSFLNGEVLREIQVYNDSKVFGYKDDDIDSQDFSEGSKKSQVSNPKYNFTTKMDQNNPLSSRGSKVHETEEDQPLNDKIKTNGEKPVPKTAEKKATQVKADSKTPASNANRQNSIMYKIYDEFDFFKDTVKDEYVMKMMEMLTLCHNSTFSGDSFESNQIVDKAMLIFAKNFNFTFEEDKFEKSKGNEDAGFLKSYKLRSSSHEAKPISTNILIINQYDDDRKRFSVLVAQEGKAGSTLYVRGIHESMIECIDFGENSKNYNDVVKYNDLNGLKTFVFAKKEFNQIITTELVKEFTNHKKKQLDQHINLKKLAVRMEKNLQLVSVIGIKNRNKEDAFSTVSTLKNMGMRVSILTGDGYHNAKRTAHLLDMIHVDEEHDHLNFNDLENGKLAIKDVLERFKKLLTTKKKAPSTEDLSKIRTAVQKDELE